MSERYEVLAEAISARFGDTLRAVDSSCGGELTYELDKVDLVSSCKVLRDDDEFQFETLIDLCGIDYLAFGTAEWETQAATGTGFSRAVIPPNIVPDAETTFDPRRFATVYHLLSLGLNHRVRLRVFAGPDNPPVLPSVVPVWSSANWYESPGLIFGLPKERFSSCSIIPVSLMRTT